MDIDYSFENVVITLNGKEYFATGQIGVNFDVEPSDRSVGFKGGAEITSFGTVIADLTDEDGNVLIGIKAKDGPAVDAIIHALDHDSIASACDEASEDW